jgi:AcrR family transcriptional regulator
LTREEVADDQRRRIMTAMAEVMAEQGYAGTSVADVIAGAGVSRQTYYQQFQSKLDCFLHAFDAASAALFITTATRVAEITEAEVPIGPAERLEAFDVLFGAYLEGITSHPELARMFLIEVYAAGPEAMERRTRLQALVTDAVGALLGASDDRGRFACQALVAAISALVTPRLAAGDLSGIRALRDPIVDLAARSLLA